MTPRKRAQPSPLPSRVYKHGQGYRLRIYVEGKPKWQRLTAKSIAEVWREVEELSNPSLDTVAAGVKRYVERVVPALLESGDLSASTWRTERRRVDIVSRVFGSMRPDDISARHLYEFPERVGDGWRCLKRFSAIWRYLLKWGLATKDPFHRFDWPKQRARKRYVTDEELQKAKDVALEASKTKPSALMVWAALTMVYLTGRRVTDVRQLKLTQIEKNVGIRFVESKTQKVTLVEWSEELGKAIDEIRARLHRDTPIRTIYLICNRDGYECSEGSLNQAWQRLRVDLLDAGIEPFQLRDIRAKYGTDHPDGRRALRHSSEAVFEKHYNRKGAVIKPIK